MDLDFEGQLEHIVPDELDTDFADDDTLVDNNSISTFLGSSWDSMSAAERHHFENGRRYHGYRAGRYWIPNDEKEQDRLDMAHHIFVLRLDGLLHLAPITEKPEKILDLGTGTGIWAIDMAAKYPEAEVIGTDLSAMQPPTGLPNLSFDIDDIESDWIYPPNHFDFVHSRILGGAIADWPRLFRQAFEHLKPGAYFEGQEVDTRILCDDGTFPLDCAWQRFHTIVNQTSVQGGRPYAIAHLLKQGLIDAGFVNVHEVKLKLPLNTWPKDRKMKKLGEWMCLNLTEGIEGFSMAPLTRVLGWSAQEVKDFIAEAEVGLKNRKYHMYYYLYFVYGQKPLTA